MPFEKPLTNDIHFKTYVMRKKYRNIMSPMMNELLIQCM